jgi:hypothetical protein
MKTHFIVAFRLGIKFQLENSDSKHFFTSVDLTCCRALDTNLL